MNSEQWEIFHKIYTAELNDPGNNFSLSSTTLVICIISLMCLSLQIKNNFQKFYRCSERITERTNGDIFISFWNICNNIAFNRAIPILVVVLCENTEKKISDHAKLLNIPVIIYLQSKQVNRCLWLNFVDKLPIVTKNRCSNSYNHSYNFWKSKHHLKPYSIIVFIIPFFKYILYRRLVPWNFVYVLVRMRCSWQPSINKHV